MGLFGFFKGNGPSTETLISPRKQPQTNVVSPKITVTGQQKMAGYMTTDVLIPLLQRGNYELDFSYGSPVLWFRTKNQAVLMAQDYSGAGKLKRSTRNFDEELNMVFSDDAKVEYEKFVKDLCKQINDSPDFKALLAPKARPGAEVAPQHILSVNVTISAH